MKKILAIFGLATLLSYASNAIADDNANPYRPHVVSESPYQFRAGFDLSAGAPDGVGLGLVVSPWLPFLKMEGAITYNYLGEGGRAGITLDPMPFPVGLTLTGDVGGYWNETIPVSGSRPTISYNYENLLGGIEFGSQKHFRFYLRGGMSHIDGQVGNFQQAINLNNGITIANPVFNGWIPAGKLGFTLLF
jgi:hypothetical protein